MDLILTLFILVSAYGVHAAPLNDGNGNLAKNLSKRDGQGGYLNLINGGPYTWNLTSSNATQMNTWKFPPNLGPYSSTNVYVEFDTSAGVTQSNDAGDAVYQLVGTNFTFQLEARAPNGAFSLQSVLNTMETLNNAQGSTIPLGWVQNESVNWILSGDGRNGAFTSSNPPVDWMQASLPSVGNLTLRQLSMPGSHDAGMSARTGGTLFVADCNTLTQTVDIGGQLTAGSRYFDIRPVITGGSFSTGHYSPVGGTSLGANGQTIDSIVSELNSFTATNKELVVINLSHSLDTDNKYPPFSQDQWDGLLTQLMAVNNLVDSSKLPAGFDATASDLSTLTLNQMISSGPAVVLVVQDSADLSTWFGKGVFSYGQYGDVFNQFSNTDDLGNMETDQVAKLQAADPSTLFLLSWTLTQTTDDAVECGLDNTAIIDLANQADPALFTDLISKASPTTGKVPNIIFIDNLHTSDVIGLSMAYNAYQAYH